MKRLIPKPKIAITVIVSLLGLSLPSFNLPKTQAMEGPSTQRAVRQLVSEPQVFEQRRSDGEVLAQLRLAPADSPSICNFHVEDLQTAGKADGTVEIASNALKVRFTDLGSKTRFGMDLQPDQETPGRTRITLLHNKKRCALAIDGEKARSIATQMKELFDQGNQAEAKKLTPALKATFSGGQKYGPFARQIAKSSAFGILSTTASIRDSLSSDDAHRNLPLHAIGLAVSILAPSSAKKAAQHHMPSQTSRAQKPPLIKTSHSASVLNHFAGLSPAQDQPNCECCHECFLIMALWIFACIDFYFLCTRWLDWDATYEWWFCGVLTAACIVAAFVFDYWCERDGCGYTESGEPFCLLDLCP